MQGRLLPPVDERFQAFPGAAWPRELELAEQAGLDAVELIWDDHRRDENPLESAEGIAALRRVSERTSVQTASVCADYFMEHTIIGANDEGRAALLARLEGLLERAQGAGVERVVLPFVDASRLGGHQDRRAGAEWIEAALPVARAAGIELHLETDLAPAEFASFLDDLTDPLVRVNYDTGNSAALGFDPAEELAAYGDRIGSVHVKDRELHGGTVPLGEGSADLRRSFALLADIGYDGDVVLQVARAQPGDELAWAIHNRALVLELTGEPT